MKLSNAFLFTFFLSCCLIINEVSAHDPIFSPGPHVLFKDGIELHTEFTQAAQGNKKQKQQTLAFKYGLSGDWVVGVKLPYQTSENSVETKQGIGDISVSTKYRFWRKDSLAVQESAAVIAKVKLNTGKEQVSSDTTDALLGLSYGFESLTWYRWASVRYRFNQNRDLDNQATLQRADRLFVDIAGGYRLSVNDYRDIDTVWLLELNGEYAQANRFNNADLANTGGSQWFISPGVMWTLRNFAIKAGVQIPVYSNLKGAQADSDYRALLEFEWHM
ncbi:MAG: transporter [Colwellia sp.]|nr:transporter [Colwellia sp.]